MFKFCLKQTQVIYVFFTVGEDRRGSRPIAGDFRPAPLLAGRLAGSSKRCHSVEGISTIVGANISTYDTCRNIYAGTISQTSGVGHVQVGTMGSGWPPQYSYYYVNDNRPQNTSSISGRTTNILAISLWFSQILAFSFNLVFAAL